MPIFSSHPNALKFQGVLRLGRANFFCTRVAPVASKLRPPRMLRACWHAGMLACWHAKSAWGGNHIRVNTTKNNQILRVPVQHYASVFRSWLGTSCHFMQQPFRRRRKHFSKIRHQHAITMKLHASMQHAHFGVDMWFAWHASASACQQPAAASEGGTCKPLKGEFHPGMP